MHCSPTLNATYTTAKTHTYKHENEKVHVILVVTVDLQPTPSRVSFTSVRAGLFASLKCFASVGFFESGSIGGYHWRRWIGYGEAADVKISANLPAADNRMRE